MRTRIIYNPKAGQAEALIHELDLATEVWEQHGWQVERCPTKASGDGTRLAREAAVQGFDLVVAAGGDGTINEVINGLVGSSTALANLPLGTMNVWARELGLPLQPRAAASALIDWLPQSIDLGRAGERYFLLMAGIGFDAAITEGVGNEEKRRFGALAYVWRGITTVLSIRGTRIRLTLDGRRLRRRVLMVVIGNSQLYGGVVKITHQAAIDDGLLDVCVIRGDNFFSALRNLVGLLLRRAGSDQALEYYRVRSLVIDGPRLPVQVDGDLIGHTPMRFDVAPRALRALLPQPAPANLVSQGAAHPAQPTSSLQHWARQMLD